MGPTSQAASPGPSKAVKVQQVVFGLPRCECHSVSFPFYSFGPSCKGTMPRSQDLSKSSSDLGFALVEPAIWFPAVNLAVCHQVGPRRAPSSPVLFQSLTASYTVPQPQSSRCRSADLPGPVQPKIAHPCGKAWVQISEHCEHKFLVFLLSLDRSVMLALF